jgi:hypothetical protein
MVADVKKVEEVEGVSIPALPLSSLRAMLKGQTAIIRKMHVGMMHGGGRVFSCMVVAGKVVAKRKRCGVSRAQGVRAAGEVAAQRGRRRGLKAAVSGGGREGEREREREMRKYTCPVCGVVTTRPVP